MGKFGGTKRNGGGRIERMDVAEMAGTAGHSNVLVPLNHY
jgi:hypothetical protein